LLFVKPFKENLRSLVLGGKLASYLPPEKEYRMNKSSLLIYTKN
jgi:hypothetical protein